MPSGLPASDTPIPPSPATRASSAAAETSATPSRLLPFLVLLAGWTFSGWMFVLLQRASVQREEEYFSERIAEAQAAISNRITHYTDALLGGTSFYSAAESVDREQWRVFTESLRLRTRYPGINGLGVVLAVPPAKVEAWKHQVRVPGEPEPEIRPFPGTTDTRPDDVKYLITFVEGNVVDRAPIGRNIATDPSRRRAAELARDSGQPQVNQRIPGSRDTQRRAGLLLYVPLYAKSARLETLADRRAAHLGWVYAQVYPDLFLDGVLGTMGQSVRLHFFEAGGLTREKVLYASDGIGPEPLPEFDRITETTLAGQRFQLGWRRGPRFPAADHSAAAWVAGSLGLASLFLAGLMASLQSVGRRANAIAEARTAELATSEERFRHAFDFAGIGMALVGLDGRFQRVNTSLCEIVGYTESKLLQKNFQDITHLDDLAADLNLLRDLIEGRRRFYQLEKRYIHRDGHNVWVRLTVSLVRDGEGTPVHAVAQVEDIADRKRLEESLAAARDQAVEASRQKSEFLATMIDEVRNPTNELLRVTRVLRTTPLSPDQSDHVRTIEISGDSLLTISNDILDYSKIEAGQIELESTPFDLRACVDNTLAVFADRARQKQIKLEATIAARVPTHAVGDSSRLHQILVNLLSNAFKFTETGEIRVNLTAEALDATTGRQRLKFAVRDTGRGIPADRMERMFKSFSPVDPNTRQLGGTGLGLAISKRLAELMGGTLWAQSEVGRGSTFHFTVVVEPREIGDGQ